MTAPETTPGADGHTPLPGVTTPIRCASCGHVTIPGRRCECGHIEELHNLADDNRTRKACSVSEGRNATPCGCRRFTPELPDFLQENH